MATAFMLTFRDSIVIRAITALALLIQYGPMPAFADDKVGLYAAINEVIHHYEVDVAKLALEKQGSVKAPARVQYAWPNDDGSILYVAASSGGPGRSGTVHAVVAYRIDRETGALSQHGEQAALPERPIHISLSNGGRYLFVTSNRSAMIEVYKIKPDGSVGGKIEQPKIDAGIYAHQTLQAKDGTVISVGVGAELGFGWWGKPGSLTTFADNEGRLTRTQRLLISEDFGPRHLEFSADQSYVYVVAERGNRLFTYGFEGGALSNQPLYRTETLADPSNPRPEQYAGAIHLHPNGETLYVANRSYAVEDTDGRNVFVGGENNIAVFSLARNGEPQPIQHVDTRGFVARTFSIDPSGKMMVVGNQQPVVVLDDGAPKARPASLAVFRIDDDGRLSFVRKYDTDATAARPMFWTGMVPR